METSRKQTTSIKDKAIAFLDSCPDMRCKSWSEDEDFILVKYYGKKNLSDIARALKRTYASVKHRMITLGLSHKNTNGDIDKQ